MSIKTLRKRITFVAVSALGASLLAVAPANASAAANDEIYVSSTNSTTGSATYSLYTHTAGVGDNTSVGVLASSGTGTTRTAVMLATGTLSLVAGGTGSGNTSIIIDGPAVIAAAENTGSTTAIAFNSARTSIFNDDGDAMTAGITPTGTGTVTLYYYTGTGVTTTARDGGTLKGKIVITVTATSTSGTYSPVYSYLKVDSADITSPGSLATNVDVTSKLANAAIGYVGVNLNDAYGVTLGAGVLQASATGGAVVKWESNPTSVSTASDVYTSASYATLHVSQGVTNANKPVTAVITLTWNGTVVGTKTILFLGDAEKITIYNNVISDLGSPSSHSSIGLTGANYKVYDSAGNWIDEPGALSADSSTLNGIVSAVTVDRVASASDSSWTGLSGRLLWTCSSTTAGSKDVTMYLYNARSQKISATLPAKCAGDTYTFKASADKAVYAPGEIITVTLQGFDVAGNPANARHLLTPKNVIASGAFASTVDEPTTSDLLADTGLDGKVSYRFIATQTEGTYTISASMPVNGAGQTAVAIPVTIKSATTAVTNAEVLAAIVKLIASINKQIRALQKSLKR